MTPVGHILTGLTLATAGMPFGASRRRMTGVLALCALASIAADLPIPGWGHDAYHVSHSLLVTLALLAGAATAVALRSAPSRGLTGRRGLALAAWLSHLLLDGLYSHGRGIAVLWLLHHGTQGVGVPGHRRRLPAHFLPDPRNIAPPRVTCRAGESSPRGPGPDALMAPRRENRLGGRTRRRRVLAPALASGLLRGMLGPGGFFLGWRPLRTTRRE